MRGPLPAWDFLVAAGELPDASPERRADWLSFHCAIAASVRDFETAEAWLAKAEALETRLPWLCIERAVLLERQDRYGEALAAARRALELHPWYRPGVEMAAHLLELLDRDAEALELLAEASSKLESSTVTARLAALEWELKLCERSRASWERVAELSPLMEKGFVRWLATRRCDAAYYCGDYEAAVRWGRESKSEFHEALAERLSRPEGDRRRVALDVGFVRQHHMTCAPATLSALARFWSAPVEHLSVVEEICYDGTSAHAERAWAARNGWVAREFTVTWEAALALLDRGVPFTLTTVEPGNAHLQAVIGYDALRESLLIRDPYERHAREFLYKPLFERYAATGPRGMALVPRDEAALLEGIELPEAALYDRLFAVNDALVRHRRDEAQAELDALQAAAPDHRLALHALRSIASYDSDPAVALECTERLLAAYPEDANLLLSKHSCLRVLGRREERVALLQGAAGKKGADPIVWSTLARELREDAGEHPAAARLLRRALRYRRADAGNYAALADILWEQSRRDMALVLYRWATCLEDKHQDLFRAYFIASRHFKREEEALRLLRDRFGRFGGRSADPGRTLFWALEQLDRGPEVFDALDKALALRPEDGALLLFAAEAHARYGKLDRAGELLAAAKDKSQATAWLRAAAQVALLRGSPPDALAMWRKVLDAEPLALDAHRMLSRLLAETEGPAAALAHLERSGAAFPHSYPLHQMWIERLRDEPADRAEPVIRRLIAIHPADGWARRELSMCLLRLGRDADAVAEAEAGVRLDPANPASHACLGKALAAVNRMADACAAQRRAIELSVDADFAIAELLRYCDSDAARREALMFVRDQLARQTIFGDGLLAFRSMAREVLGGEELMSVLRAAMAERPALWHVWSAIVRQQSEMGNTEGAGDLAREAVRRFPLVAPL